MLDQEEYDPPREQAKHVLRERVGGSDGVRGVDHRGHDEKPEGRHDRVPGVKPGPHGIDEVTPEEGQEHGQVREGHPPCERHGPSKCLGVTGPARRGQVIRRPALF